MQHISHSTRNSPIVVLGSRGAAGQMHTRIHKTSALRTIEVDLVDGTSDLAARDDSRIPWGDAIVDVCTPTALHGRSIIHAYTLGARRFIVEKPQASSAREWQDVLDQIPGAKVCAVQNYLWSTAFWRAIDTVGDPVAMSSTFDKDREDDDRRGRGAHDGRLAHTLQVEAPHQFAMFLAVRPDLEVAATRVAKRGARGCESDAHTAVAVTLKAPSVEAQLVTDLRSTRRRTLRLVGSDGRTAEVVFATISLRAAVYLDAGHGPQLHWDGEDDALRRTLENAVESLESDRIPRALSADFSMLILKRIDESIALASKAAEAAVQ